MCKEKVIRVNSLGNKNHLLKYYMLYFVYIYITGVFLTQFIR